MPRRALELLPFNPEIEKTCRALTKATKQRKEALTMAENNNEQPRILRDFAIPTVNGANRSITRPAITANNFELKPALIQMVQQIQFGGGPSEDPNIHLENFLDICDTIKLNGVTNDAIRLRLFPFSLKDRAKSWLTSKPAGTFTT